MPISLGETEELGRKYTEAWCSHDHPPAASVAQFVTAAYRSVLVDFVQALIRDDAAPGANERYNEELKKLTAAEWLKSFR